MVGCSGSGTDPAVVTTEHTPDVMPTDVIRGLNTDPAVLDCFAASPGESVIIPNDAIAHRFIDLDADGRDDLIVDAVHACLAGANGLRWAYLQVDDTWRLAGRAVPNLDERFKGKWLPKSAVYYALEPLHISSAELVAGACEPTTYLVQPASNGAQLVFLDTPECTLNGDRLAVFELREGQNVCELVLTVYANAAAARSERLVSRGVFSRSDCP